MLGTVTFERLFHSNDFQWEIVVVLSVSPVREAGCRDVPLPG